MGGGAPEGNTHNQRFDTPAKRLKAFVAFLDHIAAGYSDASFHDPCLSETIYAMAKRYPEELPNDFIRRSKAKGLMLWEQMGLEMSKGSRKGNPLAWKFNMQNRYAWKEKSETGFDKDTRAVFKLRMGKDLGKDGQKDDAHEK